MVVRPERQAGYLSMPTISQRRNTQHIFLGNASSLHPLAPHTHFPLKHRPLPNWYAEEPVNCQHHPCCPHLATIRLRLRRLYLTCPTYHMANTPRRSLLQYLLFRLLFLLTHMTHDALSQVPQYPRTASWNRRRRVYTHAHFLPLRLRQHQTPHFLCYLSSLLIPLFLLLRHRYLGLFPLCIVTLLYRALKATHISDILPIPTHLTITSGQSRYHRIMLRTLTYLPLYPFRHTPPPFPKL
jgi:hypothetical protein